MLNKVPDPYKECLKGAIIGIPIFGILTVFALFLQWRQDEASLLMYLLICICGWLTGWFFGVLYAPLSPKEESQAQKTFTVIATFASGYLVGAIGPFLEHASAPENLLMTFKGILFFVASFFTTLTITVIFRRYYEEPLSKIEAEKVNKTNE